jgi:hypothetical protein
MRWGGASPFPKVAHFEEVGFKFNRWIDVGYWQRTLRPTRHTPPEWPYPKRPSKA